MNNYSILRKVCRLLCHQKEDRCFKMKNYTFPLCARCTGIIISFTISLFLLYYKLYINIIFSFLGLFIMFFDWFIQFLNIKKSTNSRRFISGICGGFGLTYIYYYFLIFLKNLF